MLMERNRDPNRDVSRNGNERYHASFDVHNDSRWMYTERV